MQDNTVKNGFSKLTRNRKDRHEKKSLNQSNRFDTQSILSITNHKKNTKNNELCGMYRSMYQGSKQRQKQTETLLIKTHKN